MEENHELAVLRARADDVQTETRTTRGSMLSVVLDSLQYIQNGDGQEELYHLGKDSWQVRNLVADSTYQADLNRYRGALRALPGNPRWAKAP